MVERKLGSVIALFETYSEADRKVSVAESGTWDNYRATAKLFALHILVGRERLFNVPIWWHFRPGGRSSMLASSIETFKHLDFVPYFVKLSRSMI